MKFSDYTATIGRGPTLSRPLTRKEAADAMAMILSGMAEPIQLGGFLLVLRQRGETAAELAGFVDAVKKRFDMPSSHTVPDIDWPSYADHHRQQPWFILAALLLAGNGIKVLMHGIDGASDGCAPTRPVLDALGIPCCRSLAEASKRMASLNFAYVGLESIAPEAERLFHLKPLLGVRSVANTFVRDLNPLGAGLTLVGIVHSAYRALHQETLGLLGQSNAAVFKGVGGEAQRNPYKGVQIATLSDGAHGLEDWPSMLDGEAFLWREEDLDPARVSALWQGKIAHPAAEASIIATAAVALKFAGQAKSRTDATRLAQSMWQNRRIDQAMAG